MDNGKRKKLLLDIDVTMGSYPNQRVINTSFPETWKGPQPMFQPALKFFAEVAQKNLVVNTPSSDYCKLIMQNLELTGQKNAETFSKILGIAKKWAF